MPVQLQFESIDDFEPSNVAKQIDPLRKLLETRDKLRDLLTKIDRSEDLEGVLEQVLQNTDELKKLSSELGVETPRKKEVSDECCGTTSSTSSGDRGGGGG
jgi:type VI secretion system protein ImpB